MTVPLLRSCLLAAAVTLACASPAAAAGTVHLRGKAYEFNRAHLPIKGAQIRVAEDPALGATSRDDGTYDLVVPDGAKVTPYIVAPGYHSVHLQTFTTDGEDLERVNFQTPTDAVYRALATLLEVPLTPEGELSECVIVSTFSTRNVRDVSFDEFTAYGAHGVAGATASATGLPAPIYFNDKVIPDRSQKKSSIDGGVIWTRVPAGVYRVTARKPGTRFASFTATCAPGRVVNANPTWGLHELGKANRTKAAAAWSATGLDRLVLTSLPKKAKVRVSCSGSGCPFKARTLSAGSRSRLDVAARLGGVASRLRAGQTVDVLVTAHAYDGRLLRYKVRSGGRASASTRCVPLGHTKPRSRC